jgi:hypothetical protein
MAPLLFLNWLGFLGARFQGLQDPQPTINQFGSMLLLGHEDLVTDLYVAFQWTQKGDKRWLV